MIAYRQESQFPNGHYINNPKPKLAPKRQTRRKAGAQNREPKARQRAKVVRLPKVRITASSSYATYLRGARFLFLERSSLWRGALFPFAAQVKTDVSKNRVAGGIDDESSIPDEICSLHIRLRGCPASWNPSQAAILPTLAVGHRPHISPPCRRAHHRVGIRNHLLRGPWRKRLRAWNQESALGKHPTGSSHPAGWRYSIDPRRPLRLAER